MNALEQIERQLTESVAARTHDDTRGVLGKQRLQHDTPARRRRDRHCCAGGRCSSSRSPACSGWGCWWLD